MSKSLLFHGLKLTWQIVTIGEKRPSGGLHQAVGFFTFCLVKSGEFPTNFYETFLFVLTSQNE
jgi:hypothetical protein